MNHHLIQEGRLAPASQLSNQAVANSEPVTGLSNGNADSPYSPMLVMGVLFIFFWFFLIRPEKKRQKKVGQMREALSKGDSVVTAGGIHGTISRAEEEYFVLKMEDGTKIKFDRNAIARLASTKAEEGGQALST